MRTPMLAALVAALVSLSACGGGDEPPTEESCIADPRAECAGPFPGGYVECTSGPAGEVCEVFPWPYAGRPVARPGSAGRP
jgi:hypothetical protein